MEDKKRAIYAILVAVVVVLGLLYSFGMNLFSEPPQLVLPDSSGTTSQEPGPGTPGEEAGVAVRVEPETVQSVIAKMSRYESYSRVVHVTYVWGGGESETLVSQVWEDDGWIRTDTEFPSGLIECSIVGPEGIWIWYPSEGEEIKLYFSDSEHGKNADLMQRLPTYEDVLALDTASITDADYVEYGKQPCIFVESEQRELGYLYRYWISVNSGLLMAAETEKSGVTVYSMKSNEVSSPMAAAQDVFCLPDGTVLRSAG